MLFCDLERHGHPYDALRQREMLRADGYFRLMRWDTTRLRGGLSSNFHVGKIRVLVNWSSQTCQKLEA